MNKIEFYKIPKIEESEEKAISNENKEYLFETIGDRTFEKMVYWIYKTEIEKGELKGQYDDIQLMSGVREYAQDCCLYLNGEKTGVIQCKHSKHNTSLIESKFAEEVIKFALYVIINKIEIASLDNFKYYIVSSSTFENRCFELIQNFNKKFVYHPRYERWLENVAKQPSFKRINLKDKKKDLEEFFTNLNIVEIDKENLNRRLQDPIQIDTLKAFSTVQAVIDHKATDLLVSGVEYIKRRIDTTNENITKEKILFDFSSASKPLINSRYYIDEIKQISIERKELVEIQNWLNRSLSEQEKPVLFIHGVAGAGKTILMRQLYRTLLKEETSILAIKSDAYSGINILELEKKLDFRTSIFSMINKLLETEDKVVVIIDQIDALSQMLSSRRDYVNTYIQLIDKLCNIDNVRIIVSIREFDLLNDSNFSVYKNNPKIKLDIFSEEEVKKILNQLNVQTERLTTKLLKVLRTPLHLSVFTSIYNNKLSFESINEIQDLYKELWRQKVVTNPKSELLYAIADKMNKESKTSLKKSLFEENNNNLKGLISENILIENKGEIQFFHQSFYDFTFAKLFVKKDQSLFDFIIQEKQILHIRSSVKMILNYLRFDNEKEYLFQTQKILNAKNINLHIKLLVINILGYCNEPTKKEKTLVGDIVLKNEQLKKYFIESAFEPEWIELLINKNIFNELIDTKKTLLDKLLESRFVNRYNIDYSGYKEKKEENLNLFYRVLSRGYPEKRNIVSKYLLTLSQTPELENLVSRILYHVKNWDCQFSIQLFNRYKFLIYKDVFDLRHILEDALKDNIDWAFGEFIEYNKSNLETSLKENYSKQKVHYSITQFFENAIKINPVKAFEVGLELIGIIIYKSQTWQNEYSDLLHDGEFYNYDDDDNNYESYLTIYADLINCSKKLALSNSETFRNCFERFKNENLISYLNIIIYGLTANPNSFLSEIIEMVSILEKKGVFNDDGHLQQIFRTLIAKAYPKLSLEQKAFIKRIYLNIQSKRELRVNNTNENFSKLGYLELYGRTQLMYIQSLPENEILADKELKRRFEELKRKHGKIEENNFIMKANWRPVINPIQTESMAEMSFDNLKKSFINFNTNKLESFSNIGGLYNHANAFKEIVVLDPQKYYSFILEIIDDPKISIEYIIKGIEGLQDGKFNIDDYIFLYKKLLNKGLDENQLISVLRLAKYIISNQRVDRELFETIKAYALNYHEHEDDREDPIFVGINSVKGIAIEYLTYCTYDSNFRDEILTTIEKLSYSSYLNVRAMIIYRLHFLLFIDEKRVVQIFVTVMKNAPEPVVKASLQALNYIVFRDFYAVSEYIKEWIKYESVQEFIGEILFICANHNPKLSNRTLFKFVDKYDKAKAGMIKQAYQNLLNEDNKIRVQAKLVFKKYLNSRSEYIVEEYNDMFLRIKEVDFIDFLPYLQLYAKSKSAGQNPQYFLDYLLEKSNEFPYECFNLLSSYKRFPRPSHHKGPYYRSEPTKVLLNCYNTFYLEANEVYIKKALKLFDDYLRIDFFRHSVNEAFELIEN